MYRTSAYKGHSCHVIGSITESKSVVIAEE
jgi:hypothetical protein